MRKVIAALAAAAGLHGPAWAQGAPPPTDAPVVLSQGTGSVVADALALCSRDRSGPVDDDLERLCRDVERLAGEPGR